VITTAQTFGLCDQKTRCCGRQKFGILRKAEFVTEGLD